MSGWIGGVYTVKGLSLLAKLTQGSSLKITRAVLGTGYVKPEQLATQTAVTGIKQELTLGRATYPERGQCKLPVSVTNQGLTTGYTAKQIGLYANDPDEGEILYFITQSENGTDVLAEADMKGYSATWTLYFKYGQAENVEITVDPANTVTPEELNEVEKLATRGVSSNKNGTVIVIEDSAELPFAKFSIYGKSVQNGTPTATTPVDIESIVEDESIEVDVVGKNLLPNTITKNTLNGITFTKNNDGSVSAVGTATATATCVFTYNAHVENGKRYILSGCPSGGRTGETYVLRCFNYNGTQTVTDDEGNGKEITFTNADGNYNFSIVVCNGVTVNTTFYPMLRLADIEDATYEPYNKQSVVIKDTNLRGVPVPSGGNYIDDNGQEWVCDEIDLVRGVHIKRIHEVTPLTIKDSLTVLSNTVRFDVALPIEAPYKTSTGNVCGYGLCTHLPFVNSYSQDSLHFYVQGSTGWLFLPLSCGTDANEIATWLEENQLTIAYQIATPIETPLSESQITACKALAANNPTTTILTDSNAEMSVDYVRKENEIGFNRVYQEIEDATFNKVETTAKALTYYVNATTGSDDNDGLTADTAFKTIQYAVDRLPKYLMHHATINVAEGTYNEELRITQFAGFPLTIQGSSDLSNASKYCINGTVLISSCSNLCTFQGFTCSTTESSAISVAYCVNTRVWYCNIEQSGDIGIQANTSTCYCYTCNIKNTTNALKSLISSHLLVNNVSGSNNTQGVTASIGGVVRMVTDLPSGFATTNYYKVTGGVITTPNGTLA